VAAGCKKESETNSGPANPATPAAPQTQPSMPSSMPGMLGMPATAPSTQVPAGDPDQLAAGDLLDVEISDLSPTNMTSKLVRVAADGGVRLLYLDQPVMLAGKNRFEAEAAVVEAYERASLIKHADVFVRRLQGGGAGVVPGPIQPFDLVRVAMMDLNGPGTEALRIARVSAKGMLGVAYIGPVKLAGLTEPQAEDLIRNKYREAHLISQAGVSVLKLESAPDNAAHLALSDAPISPIPEILKPLYFPWAGYGTGSDQKH